MSFRSLSKLLVGLSFFACTSLFAAPLVVNVAGIESHGELGDSDNTVLTFNVGANAHIASLQYLVNLTAFGTSWLSEMNLAFTDSSGFGGVVFYPGYADENPGTGTYADSVNLDDYGLGFDVGADGILRLEFFEDFDDAAGVDGRWNFGTLTFGVVDAVPLPEVPEPASALLIGLGAALMGYTRRRRAARTTA